MRLGIRKFRPVRTLVPGTPPALPDAVLYRLLIVLFVLALGWTGTGCLAEPPRDCGAALTCEATSECAFGEVCEDGCCAPYVAEETRCADNRCCSAEGCVSYEELCAAPGQCDCAVHLGDEGAALVPHAVLAPGETLAPRATLRLVHGVELLAATFVWELTSGASFELRDGVLAAGASGGTARLEARFGDEVRCAATLDNLGARPAGTLRVHAYDAQSGTPVPEARVVFGEVEELTDALGVALHVAAAATTVTLLATGYAPLTLAGVPPDRDLGVPLSPWQAPVGGISGEVDFTRHEAAYGDEPPEVAWATVGAGLTLSSLPRFSTDALLGGPVLADSCTTVGAGCRAFGVPGLLDAIVPSPGGVVLTPSNRPFGASFEVTAAPGWRHLFSLGGELTTEESRGLVAALLPATAPEGAAGGLGGLLRQLSARLSRTTLAVGGPYFLPAAGSAQWLTYVDEPFAERPVDARFPVLDRHSPLMSEHLLSDLTVVPLPPLPEGLDAVLVLTGAATPSGLVPLGLGAGFDCTGPGCAGANAAPERYDGRIDGVAPCDPALLTARPCPAPLMRRLDEQEVAVLSTPTARGLERHPRRTVLLALGADGPESGRGLSALLRDGAPGEQDLAHASFPATPPPVELAGRTLRTTPAGPGVLRVVELTLAQGQRWRVLLPPGSDSVTLPSVALELEPTVSVTTLTPALGGDFDWLQSAALRAPLEFASAFASR